MTKCPRCQSLVDETTQAACPICFAPLTLPPGAVALPPMPASSVPTPSALGMHGTAAATPMHGAPLPVRVALTGEVVPSASPVQTAPAGPYTMNPASGPYGNVPAPPSPAAVPIPRHVYGAPYRRQEAAPDHARRNAVLISLGVVLAIALMCGGGGWWWWAHRTNPKAQAQRYLHAIQWLDFGVVYDLSAAPPGNRSRSEFLSKMDEKFDSNGLLRIMARRGMEQYHYAVGEPTVNGNEATVPVTISGGSDEGSHFELKLRNFGGIWKIYPTTEDPMELFQ